MRPILALATGLLALVLSSGAALACSCMRPQSAAAHAASADTIFVGEAIGEARRRDREVVTRFRVEQVLKGKMSPTLLVRHGLDSAACGVQFQPGARVLVLARRGEGGELETSLCSGPMFPEAEYRRALNMPGPQAGQCDARAAQFAVGARYSQRLGARAQRAAGAGSLRVRKPDMAYTQDLRSDRLNLDLNRNGRVRRVVCG